MTHHNTAVRPARPAVATGVALAALMALAGCAHQEPQVPQVQASAPVPTVATAPATAPSNLDAAGPALAATTPSVAPAITPSPAPSPIPTAAPGQAVRVGGDMAITANREGQGEQETWRVGTALINTPLPVGYAPPTPPGAIDLKSYPSLRRAEYTGRLTPSIGMNMGFFPLFNHIKRRDIAMTSPVEMDYEGFAVKEDQPARPDGDKLPTRWTMSFLYRQQEQGPTGQDQRDQRVTVVDTPPRTVVAIGFQGGYGLGRVKEQLGLLAEWLAADGRWEPTGEPRALYYNGPEQRDRFKWGEVQLPVRPRQPTTP